MIAALVLAGGESRRMGQPKLLLEHRGKTLLAGAIKRAACVADQVFTVVGAYSDLYRPEAEWAGAVVVENPNWSEGLASSLRAVVATLEPEVEAALVILPDQPFVPTKHLKALIGAYRETGSSLVFSRYQGTHGAPTLIARSHFPSVLELRGENGAKTLKKTEAPVTYVELENGWDVDTPSDANRLQT
jgi:molybdenum cofactor cytidylyltransferase